MNESRPGIKLALVVGDLHCGSKHGLLHPGYFMDDGNEVRQNEFQRWLWTQWIAMNEWAANVVGSDPFDLIANGDLTEGEHHRTKELVDPDPACHPRIAFKCLEPLNNKAKASGGDSMIVKGTPAHVGTRAEDGVASELDSIRDDNRSRHAFYRLPVTYHGCVCRFSHHISATVRAALEGTALSIQLAEEQLRAAKEGRPIPKVIGRAHRHAFGVFEDTNGLAFVTPAWQGMTAFVSKILPAAELTTVGAVLLDWRKSDYGGTPTVHRFLRTQPPLLEVMR